MSFPDACCTLPPLQSDYTPKGRVFSIGDLPVYETEDVTPSKILICAYDIFGVHPNIRQVSDILAKARFRVVIPDFFRGHEIDSVNWPPKDRQVIYDFVDEHGSWEKTVKKDVANVIKHYQEKNPGVYEFGIFGFCYGGRVCIDAITELPEIGVAVLLHPSLWTTEDARKIKKPTLLLPAKDDADMTDFYDILKKNVGEDKCGHRRFDDMPHGFMGARGNWKDPLNYERSTEAIKLMQQFFSKHLR